MPSSQHINPLGLSLIKSCEGCQLTAYKDCVGIWTIGYGHTGSDVQEGLEIDQAQADAFLEADLGATEQYVCDAVKVPLNTNEFSALVSLVYNIGIGNFEKSLLLRCLNTHHRDDAAKEFLKWDKAGGKFVPGLLVRRGKEQALFLTA